MDTRRTTPNNFGESNVPSSNPPKPTRLTPQKMDGRRTNGMCFNCDNKYTKGHKCGEKKIFYIDYEEEEENEQEPSPIEEIKETPPKESTPTISCYALVAISTPQTLKIKGYIKRKKVLVLIDSGSTHNFIHCKLAKAHNCFI
jgi:hypothetical protein